MKERVSYTGRCLDCSWTRWSRRRRIIASLGRRHEEITRAAGLMHVFAIDRRPALPKREG
jgi:hypothetical protein